MARRYLAKVPWQPLKYTVHNHSSLSKASRMASSVAMYYPWRDINDAGWLKSCLLYWDEVHTMVAAGEPEPYRTPETRFFAESGLLTPVYPDEWNMDISDGQLLDLMSSNEWSKIIGRQKSRKVQRFKDLYTPDDDQVWGGFLKRRISLGIENWDLVDRNVATLYLTILAANRARYGAWSLVTDRPGLRALAESIRVGYPLPEAIEAGDVRFPQPKLSQSSFEIPISDAEAALGVQFILKSIEIDSATPPEKIIEFRNKYRDELGRFRLKIAELASSAIGEYPSYDAFQQTVADIYRNSVEPSISALDEALRGQRITTRLSWLSVSSLAAVPVSLSHIPGPIGTIVGVVAGGALALAVQQANSRARARALESDNPYSYVLRAKAEFS